MPLLTSLLLVSLLIIGKPGNAALKKSVSSGEILEQSPSSTCTNPILAILDFDTDTLESPQIKALSQALWTSVHHLGDINMLPRESTRNWLISNDLHPFMPYQDNVPLDQIIDFLNVDYLLLGRINRLEESFLLELNLLTAPAGRALMYKTSVKRADLNAMLNSMGSVAQHVQQRIARHSHIRGDSVFSSRPLGDGGNSERPRENRLQRDDIRGGTPYKKVPDHADSSDPSARGGQALATNSGSKLKTGLKPATSGIKKIINPDNLIDEFAVGAERERQDVVHLNPVPMKSMHKDVERTVSARDPANSATRHFLSLAKTPIPVEHANQGEYTAEGNELLGIQAVLLGKQNPGRDQNHPGRDSIAVQMQPADDSTVGHGKPQTNNANVGSGTAESPGNSALKGVKPHVDTNDGGKASTLNKAGATQSTRKRARKLYESGLKMKKGLPRRLKTFQDVVNLIPADPRYRKRLAKEYYNHDLYPECIEICRKVLVDHPNDSMLLTLKGSAHYELRQYDASMEANRNALSADASNNWARFNYALTLMASDSPETPEAWRIFIEHARQDPKPAIRSLLEPAGEYLAQVSGNTP